MLEYRKAKTENAGEIYGLVQATIKAVYPRYYPKEVVDFFCRHHNLEHILADIGRGDVGLLKEGDQLIGTGSRDGNHITRVYVNPDFQGRGYGSHIIEILEREIGQDYDTVNLDASLPASCLYERRGYRTVKHETREVENQAVLVYEIMQKQLDPAAFGTDVQRGGTDVRAPHMPHNAGTRGEG